MGSVIDPAKLNGSTYLMVNNGIIEDLGCAFTSLTGYSKSDFYHKRISEVMNNLFGFNLEPELNVDSRQFLFKKTCDAIEVRITVYEIGDAGHKLYIFRQIPNLVLNSELSFIDKITKDNNLGVGLYSSPDYRLLKANRMYLEYMRDAWNIEGKITGRCLGDTIPNFSGSEMEEMWRDISNTGETVLLKEQQIISENGCCNYWNQNITPISEGGSVKYIVTILEDVTESMLKRKHAEEKNEELRKTIEMKDEMLLLISHELKTPLSIITSSVQTVEIVCKNELTERVAKYLNKIRQSTYRQLKLINNILDNTRVNAGLFKINNTNVDIVFLTRSIIDSIVVFAERKGIKLSFSSEAEQAIVKMDVDIYERILLNLLSNAVKFTPEGNSVEINISQAKSKRKQVCIQVKDHGIGIPNDQKELIFERFGRVNKLVARQSEGTGIGLYLVKMLVSLLGGDITVESTEGIGSTFTLLFPLLDMNVDLIEPLRVELPGDKLAIASAIEFSDIYYGT